MDWSAKEQGLTHSAITFWLSLDVLLDVPLVNGENIKNLNQELEKDRSVCMCDLCLSTICDSDGIFGGHTLNC